MQLYKLKNKYLLPFKFKKLKSWKFFLTSEVWDWVVLQEEDFRRLIEGKKIDDNLKQLLIQKNILRDESIQSQDLLKNLAWKWLVRNNYLLRWTSLHIMVVTLACNQACPYCHASAPWKWEEYHMSKDLAKKVVDVIFQTTSWDITIEFQWWEPLLNWDVVKFVIEYAREKNKEYNLNLQFALVSNFTMMDEEKLKFLIADDIWISTSLDGPQDLHDKNRPWSKWSAWEKVVYWIKRINEEYKKRWMNWKKVGAIATATRYSLDKWKEIVDTYVELDIPAVFIRPLNPYGFAQKTWSQIGYKAEEYIDFYKKLISYIKELQSKWVNIKDAYSEGIIGANMCSMSRVNYMEARNPCWAVLWQIAYNWNGKIYTCDEWRMLAEVGDESFYVTEIDLNKDAKQIRYEIVTSWITKTMLHASMMDFVPWYDTSPITHYCWLCPIYSYTKSGNIVSKYRKEERERIDEMVVEEMVEREVCGSC